MAVTTDPLTSADGTPLTVQSTREQGRAQTQDEAVLEHLAMIASALNRILSILELEFELHSEDLNLNGEN